MLRIPERNFYFRSNRDGISVIIGGGCAIEVYINEFSSLDPTFVEALGMFVPCFSSGLGASSLQSFVLSEQYRRCAAIHLKGEILDLRSC